MYKLYLFLFINFFSMLSFAQIKTKYTYLFLGHTYLDETLIDPRLELYNKDKYDNIWLGGDICSETFLYKYALDYLQLHLRINDAHNYWSLGNHDRRNGNLEMFETVTGKKAYYSDYYNGITSIILDTNLDPSDCENLNNQFRLISNVTDTISKSSHLFLFFHWGIWSGIPSVPEPLTYAHTDLKYWNSNCDSTNNNFVQIIYPKLVEVQKRGVQVICVMGDMGAGAKKFQHKSNDNIVFLGSGLNNIKYLNDPAQWWTKEKDLILEFNHDLVEKTITWEFKDLDSLLDVQNGIKYLQKITFDDFYNYPSSNIQYVSYENYLYKLNSLDSLNVLDYKYSNTFNPTNNEIIITGAIKSSYSVNENQIEIVFELLNDNNLIEKQIQYIDNIPSILKYYKYNIQFENQFSTANNLKIYIKSVNSMPIYLNDIMIKYY